LNTCSNQGAKVLIFL